MRRFWIGFATGVATVLVVGLGWGGLLGALLVLAGIVHVVTRIERLKADLLDAEARRESAVAEATLARIRSEALGEAIEHVRHPAGLFCTPHSTLCNPAPAAEVRP